MLESQDVLLVETSTVGDVVVPGLQRCRRLADVGRERPPDSDYAMTPRRRSTGGHPDQRKGLFQ